LRRQAGACMLWDALHGLTLVVNHAWVDVVAGGAMPVARECDVEEIGQEPRQREVPSDAEIAAGGW
jgi:hypothetical protein